MQSRGVQAAKVPRHVATNLSGVDPGTGLGGVVAPNFTLRNQFGKRVSLRHFRHRVVVLAFIDSQCTTLCPLTSQTLLDAQKLLGSAAHEVSLVAVNVNTVANTVADVRAWSASHSMLHHWQFLTGSAAALTQVAKAYHIGILRVHGTVEHTPAVFVINRRGNEEKVFLTSSNAANIPAEAGLLAHAINRWLPQPVALRALPQTGAPPHLPQNGRFRLPALGVLTTPRHVSAGQGTPKLVAFFATWCQACQADLATLTQYQAARARRPQLPALAVVDLRVAEPSTAWVKRFIQQKQLPFAVGLDRQGRVSTAYGVTALPLLAYVSGSGRIVWRHTGVLSLHALEAQVRKAAG